MNPDDFMSFLDGYLQGCLWSSSDDNDKPLDAQYTPGDFAPESLDRMTSDARRFFDVNGHRFASGYHSMYQAGVDLWLTRAGHGSGYWDGDYPEHGNALCASIVDLFGESNIEDPYVGDDGQLYLI